MHSSLKVSARKGLSALVCAAAFIVAGCHHRSLTSGYGIGWVSMTAEPSTFASFQLSVSSIYFTGSVVGLYPAVSAPHTVDFARLGNLSELVAAATVPNDTYTQATINLDFSAANISVLVNGVPTKATVLGPDGAALTTYAVNVTLDPANQLVVAPTYASTNAVRVALDFDLLAATTVDTTVSPPTVTVRPYFSVSTSAADSKLIRIRGPLINSALGVGTYTVYVRSFYDEVYNLGTLTIFNDANTIYHINGVESVGKPGLTQLSQSSAATTIAAAYTTFAPSASPLAQTYAGTFSSKYVVAGSTLEDFYTQGLEGDVVARSGDTLTVRGSTLTIPSAQLVQYNDTDAIVTLGPSTIVTVDGSAGLPALSAASVGIGQHVIVRGLYSLAADGTTAQLDATGNTATNTGSVRILSTPAYGTLLANNGGTLTVNLQSISGYPVSAFNFAGSGASAASDSAPANYVVSSGTAALPDPLAVGDPLFIHGYTAPFGGAPPDFNALVLDNEATEPATLQADWSAGTSVPFSLITADGLTIDLANAALTAAVINVGAETVTFASLPASPSIVSALASTPLAVGLPPVFRPVFGVGGAADGIAVFNTLAAYVTQLTTVLPTKPVSRVTARGTFNRAANVFTASSIDVVN